MFIKQNGTNLITSILFCRVYQTERNKFDYHNSLHINLASIQNSSLTENKVPSARTNFSGARLLNSSEVVASEFVLFTSIREHQLDPS